MSSQKSGNQHYKATLGRLGEDIAARFLISKGYQLITRNYRLREGEIDLIMADQDVLIFVEVKTRRSMEFGNPEDALTKSKMKKILLAIKFFMRHNQINKRTWRCDLIAIIIDGHTAKIKHYLDIFEI